MTDTTTAPALRRGLTAAALNAERTALRLRLADLDRAQVRCGHCAHFDAGGHCAVAGQQVPEEFQRTTDACTDWVWDEIPF
jgi:hypothetical protein